MPRLRRKKEYDYENIPDFSYLREQEDEDNNDTQRYTQHEVQNEVVEHSYNSTKGWWSTSSIVGSLSETKIRQTIENYRQAISILENELVSRRVAPTKNLRSYERLVIQETRRTTGRNVHILGTNERRILGVLAKLRISGSQRTELRREWNKILRENKGK